MKTLSAEKTIILNMTDDEVKTLLRLVSGTTVKRKKAESEKSAYERLEKLVGLSDVKKIIRRMVAENKMRMIAASRGKSIKKKNNHMCFIGNPGTFKTSMAEFCAHIFYEEGITKTKNVVIADRADLVGEHCGETAIKTKKLVKKAEGGVLFIDEAYSLVEDRDGGFGDEAINTLVSEIENNRDRFILILAGYPDKMKAFLKKNPGLKSRIPNTIFFPDYSPEELYRIALDIAADSGYTFDKTVKEKLMDIFERAIKEKDFGNGRFVRNLVERAQASKAEKTDFSRVDEMSDEELFMLTADDFAETDSVDNHVVEKKVGFM